MLVSESRAVRKTEVPVSTGRTVSKRCQHAGVREPVDGKKIPVKRDHMTVLWGSPVSESRATKEQRVVKYVTVRCK